MSDSTNALTAALHLVTSGDQGLVEIVALSLKVSLVAVAFAATIGLPLGALLAVHKFRGRSAIIVAANAQLLRGVRLRPAPSTRPLPALTVAP